MAFAGGVRATGTKTGLLKECNWSHCKLCIARATQLQEPASTHIGRISIQDADRLPQMLKGDCRANAPAAAVAVCYCSLRSRKKHWTAPYAGQLRWRRLWGARAGLSQSSPRSHKIWKVGELDRTSDVVRARNIAACSLRTGALNGKTCKVGQLGTPDPESESQSHALPAHYLYATSFSGVLGSQEERNSDGFAGLEGSSANRIDAGRDILHLLYYRHS